MARPTRTWGKSRREMSSRTKFSEKPVERETSGLQIALELVGCYWEPSWPHLNVLGPFVSRRKRQFFDSNVPPLSWKYLELRQLLDTAPRPARSFRFRDHLLI